MNLRSLTLLALALVLAACSRSPEEAQKKLTEMQVPTTPEALIAKTKNAKSEDVARMLVEAGVDVNARQANGMTALMSAAFNGQQDVAEALLKRGADTKADAGGYNALSLAAEKSNRSMVKLLLKNGADPMLRPENGLSALERAEQRGDKEMVELLRSGAK